MSIFISIGSYRDPELVRTIKSAIDNASRPDELYFGVVVQDFDRDIPDLSWVKNLSLIVMHPKEARGAGFARSKAMTLYAGQDYYLQIDSHTIFEKNWDVMCISQLQKAQEIAKNKKIILSHFPPAFHVESNNKISYITKDKDKPPYATKQVPTLNRRNEWTAKRLELSDTKKSMPELSTTILAGFVFTTGNIVEEIPYDPEISFFGEEICFAMRAWTRGWDIYSPCVTIVHHFYHRGNYKKIWKDRNLRKISWKEIEQISKDKQMRVLCGIEKGDFGAGSYRHLKAYEKLIGFDFKKMYGLTESDNESTIVLREKS
jgi:hypothetical protein